MSEQSTINKTENILIVDDTPENLDILSEMLRLRGYTVRPVTSGKQALDTAMISPPDLILLDINMPDMNGYEVCELLKLNGSLSAIPVIFISALNETLDKVKAFSVGGVDYITKPFQYEEVLARVETHLHIRNLQRELEKHNLNLEEMVKEKIKELYESQMATIQALAEISESRDDDTGKHLDRVQIYCRMLAFELSKNDNYKNVINESYIDNIYFASPLHDIGKVAIPDYILLKPGKLTPDEFEIMKTHTTLGANTLENVRKKYPANAFINMGIGIAHHHHEKWDGSGYPEGLSGEDIPLSARIMTIADVYDALRSKRIYKEPFTHKDSCDIIIKGTGTQFDPVIIETFKELQESFKLESEKHSG